MHSVWFFFLRKQEFSWLLIATLIAIGIYSVVAIPKESAPEVVVPIGIVTTVYQGASANDVEDLITIPLEDAVENVEDLEKLTSVSRDGVSSITAEFSASADIDESIQKLKDAVDSTLSELPRDAEDPIVSEVNFSNQPIHTISISSDASPSDFARLSEKLKDEFSSVKGVSEVVVTGVRAREIQIVISPEQLAAFDVSITDITAAIAQNNGTTPVGVITAGGVEYGVRLDGTLRTVADVETIPVKNIAGSTVFIRDLATVADHVAKPSSLSRVSVGGVPAESAMTLSIYKKSGVNVTEMSDAVNAKLAELQAVGGLLENSQVLVIFDQGEQTKNDLIELVRAGLETVALVMVSLLLTIGWRESLVAGLSIPLSFVIAFIGLYASGNTINFISLFALILAVGILVDSGIVVTEAIHTRLKRSGDALQAAILTIKEYSWPLIGGTMTTVAVFAPLFFLSGVTGEFISSIPFTIIFVLLASIVVALGMVPLIAIWLTADAVPNKLELLQEHYTERAQAWYRAKLVYFLANARAQRVFLWMLFAGFVLAIALPVTGLLKVIFFPPEDVDFMYVDIETKQGTPLFETDLAVRTVEEILYEVSEIESFSSTAGTGSIVGTASGARYGNITLALKEDREVTSAEIASVLREKFAEVKGITIKVSEQQNGPPTGAPVSIKFVGEDMTELNRAAEAATLILSSIEGVRDIDSSSDSSATEFVLAIDRVKAEQLGVSPAAVATALRARVYGLTATTISRNGEDVDVVLKLGNASEFLRFENESQVNFDSLRNMEIGTFNGETILLGTILTNTLSPATAAINREDKERVVSVTAYTTKAVTATEVLSNFKDRQAELDLPTTIKLDYGGEAEDIQESFTEMFIALVAGLLLMLAILVLSFNSVRYSFYLLLAVPYSLIGVFTGLALAGLTLSFTSLLGVIALSGVIINHAIILMDSLITHKSLQTESVTLLDQVADASVSRFRPIVLTTVTTVVGMIPLSTISDFWSPLAIAIMFGLAFAMILTLILVPTLYYRHELKKQ